MALPRFLLYNNRIKQFQLRGRHNSNHIAYNTKNFIFLHKEYPCC